MKLFNLTDEKEINDDLAKHSIKFIKNYNRNDTYKLGVSFTHHNILIITSINNDIIYSAVV